MLLFILAACSLLNDTYNTKHAIATVVRPSDTPIFAVSIFSKLSRRVPHKRVLRADLLLYSKPQTLRTHEDGMHSHY